MTDKNDILQRAEKLVYDKLHAEASGHDWWHAVRVIYHKQAFQPFVKYHFYQS